MASSDFNVSLELRRLAEERGWKIRKRNPHKYEDWIWGYICGFGTYLGITAVIFFIWFMLQAKHG